MSTALPMHARLYPKADDASFVDAREIARRVAQACPQAVIDWGRGDEWVEASLQRLISHGTPEIILEGHRHLFGRTVHISVSYPDWPNRPVFTYVSGIQSGLDTLFLEIADPFDLDLLKRGAQDLAAALSFEYCLLSNRDWVITTLTSPGRKDPVAFVRWDMPADNYPTLTLQALTDWKATTHNAVVRWLSGCESRDKIQAITEGFASHAAFADAIVNELEAIAPVDRGWGIAVAEAPHQNAILLDHGNWMTLVRLFGVLKWIVNEPAR